MKRFWNWLMRSPSYVPTRTKSPDRTRQLHGWTVRDVVIVEGQPFVIVDLRPPHYALAVRKQGERSTVSPLSLIDLRRVH